MFGKRTTKSSSRGKAAAAPFDRAKFATALGTVMLVLILSSVAVGFTLGFEPLEARAIKILNGSKPVSVSIAWPMMDAANADSKSNDAKSSATAKPTPRSTKPAGKTWLPEQFQEQLLETATRALGDARDPYSREALRLVGESMQRSGWFDTTPTIVRRSGGDVHVEGTWRVGAAVVKQGSKLVLVSWNAKPMPVEYDLDTKLGSLSVITGVNSPLPKTLSGAIDFSQTWAGSDLEAGLELLALVSKQPWRDQIQSVDVSKYPRTKQLEVQTARGGRIVWGGRPTAPLPGETSTREKLDKLAWLNRQYKSIDGGRLAIEISGQRPFEIDVSATSASVAGAKGQ